MKYNIIEKGGEINMSFSGKYHSEGCCLIGVVISIIVGIIIGILFAFGFIPNIVTAVWIAFGFAVLTLIFLVVAVFLAVYTESKILIKCLKRNISCLLVGIIGTLIFALAALSIVLNPAFVTVVILIGLGAFFTSLMLILLICFILCIVDKLCFGHFIVCGKEQQ